MYKCVGIGADTARLACYDKVTTAALGSWRIATQTSPAGGRNVYLSLNASALTFDETGQSVRPILWVRCQDGQTALFVSWNTYLGVSEAEVSYRVDASPQRTESWIIANDQEAIGLWRDADAVAFIKALLGAEQLAVEVTRYDGDAIKGRFDVAGLKQAIAPLRNACGW